jgi:hypothetical protein
MGAARFAEYELENPNFGEMVFLDDGAVVLGTKAFPAGTRIENFRFGGQLTANRPAGFDQMLTVANGNGDPYHFRFNGVFWYRLVPLAVSDPPLTYKLHKLVAHLGAGGLLMLLLRVAFIVFVCIPCFLAIIAMALYGNPIAIFGAIFVLPTFLFKFLTWYRDKARRNGGRR